MLLYGVCPLTFIFHTTFLLMYALHVRLSVADVFTFNIQRP